MTLAPVFVYGASGHGRVVAETLLAAGRVVAGFVDDDPSLLAAQILGRPVVGNGEWLRGQGPRSVALGVGDNRARALLHAELSASGMEMVRAIHPSAIVSPSATLGSGVVVFPMAVVNAGAIVEEGVILNSASVVEHDCHIGAFAHLGPRTALGGSVTIGARTLLGVGAAVLPFARVGADAIVGAGSCVTRTVEDGAVVVGVPARALRRG